MDKFLATVYMVLGILLRIGIPFAVTFVLAVFLRRLDTKWRVEALQAQPGEAVLFDLWSSNPCWAEKDCSEEQREQCPAYHQNEKSCWAVFQENGNLQAKCQNCEYRKELLFTERINVEAAQR
jgi:hypothetical protein